MNGALAVILAVAAVAAVWGWSMWRHPWRKCLRCGGSGLHADTSLFRGTAGRCRCCGGNKAHVRPDVRVLTPGRAARLRSGDPGRYG